MKRKRYNACFYPDIAIKKITVIAMLPWVTPAIRSPLIQHGIFDSFAAQSKVSYHIYKPELYDIEQERYFPVLYWLHGSGGGLDAIPMVTNYFDTAIRKGEIPPMLIVFPHGMGQSLWVNSKDGSVPMETVVVKELIPHIDANYRTIDSPGGRLVEGFSMGGYGAARLGFKYPDKFGAISILGGGPMQPEFKETPRCTAEEREIILLAIFGGDHEYFKAVSPWKMAEQNAAAIGNKSIVRLVVGENDETLKHNCELHEHLKRCKILHEFKLLPGITHSAPEYYNTLGMDNWKFYNLVFKPS